MHIKLLISIILLLALSNKFASAMVSVSMWDFRSRAIKSVSYTTKTEDSYCESYNAELANGDEVSCSLFYKGPLEGQIICIRYKKAGGEITLDKK